MILILIKHNSCYEQFLIIVCHYSGPPLNVVSLNQVEKDLVMVGYDHILVVCGVGGASLIT